MQQRQRQQQRQRRQRRRRRRRRHLCQRQLQAEIGAPCRIHHRPPTPPTFALVSMKRLAWCVAHSLVASSTAFLKYMGALDAAAGGGWGVGGRRRGEESGAVEGRGGSGKKAVQMQQALQLPVVHEQHALCAAPWAALSDARRLPAGKERRRRTLWRHGHALHAGVAAHVAQLHRRLEEDDVLALRARMGDEALITFSCVVQAGGRRRAGARGAWLRRQKHSWQHADTGSKQQQQQRHQQQQPASPPIDRSAAAAATPPAS